MLSVIENGKWVCGRGRKIEISSKGTILNGQHRLTAIVRSGKSVEIVVARRVVVEEVPANTKNVEKKLAKEESENFLKEQEQKNGLLKIYQDQRISPKQKRNCPL